MEDGELKKNVKQYLQRRPSVEEMKVLLHLLCYIYMYHTHAKTMTPPKCRFRPIVMYQFISVYLLVLLLDLRMAQGTLTVSIPIRNVHIPLMGEIALLKSVTNSQTCSNVDSALFILICRYVLVIVFCCAMLEPFTGVGVEFAVMRNVSVSG